MTAPSSLPKYTDQQKAAIETRGVSIALSAGAGCGKTFVLTQRFLSSLETKTERTELHSLVAITFSDRAAREMRDRIRSACQQRLQQCPAEDVDYWLSVLRGLDAARISTIHSFCTSILRAQAVEAGLDPRFTVMEPALADTLLTKTAKETLHGLLERADADAEEFVLKFGLERTHELLRNLARQRFQIDFGRFRNRTPEQIAKEWQDRWQTEFVPFLIAKLRSSVTAVRLAGLLKENQPSNATMRERRGLLLEWLEPTCEWNNPDQVLESLHDAARVQGGGNVKAWSSEVVYEAVKDGLRDLRDDIKTLQSKLPVNEQDLKLAAEFSARALRLAELTASAYEDAKRVEGVLDFDDLLLQARNLLRSQPEVRARVEKSIQLLMVDEFQDTDPVQAEIVQMLCGEALTLGRLFLVGDAKQSIYRFRRADPGVFARLRQQIPETGRLPLSVNFRSQPAVLDFVNHVFSFGMPDSYEALDPVDSGQQSLTPAIEFLFARFDADETVPRRHPADTNPHSSDHSQHDEDHVTAAALRSREADWIARRCAELLADPEFRIRTKDAQGKTGQGRRVKAGDIVILFRALSNVQEYEAALRAFDLDYYLVGGKAFFAQQEVYDLLNLCRYLDDPDDLIGLIGVLRSPFFNLSDDTIHTLATSYSESDYGPGGSGLRPTLHDNLYRDVPTELSEEQQWRVANARTILTELRRHKDRLPLSKLLGLAVEKTGYDAALLTEYLGPRKVANLRKLIDMATDFDQAELFTLKDFVQRLQSSVMDETDEEFATTLPETGEVIRLMSIHQSKGLEFPVVIVADLDRKKPPRGKPAVLHPELGALVKLPESFGQAHQNLGAEMFELMESEADALETIRLFYVACTRAADYLILSAGIEVDTTRRAPWFQLIESRFDIETGLPKIDPLLGSSTAKTAGRTNIPDIRVHHAPANVKRPGQTSKHTVPLPDLVELIRSTEPADLPAMSIPIGRDVTDFPPLSVSRLETIDADLLGISHVRPDRLPEFEQFGQSTDQATELGTLIHAVMERLDFRQLDRWRELLSSVVTSTRDSLSDETIAAAEKMIARLVESDIAGELAAAKSLHREVEFVMRWPSNNGQAVLVRGIIDVLYEDADGGWHILDYKTNDFPMRADDAQLLAPYEFQLAVYGHAVTQWLGQAPQELSLIALRPTVRRIALPWSPELWMELEVRIHASIEAFQITQATPSRAI